MKYGSLPIVLGMAALGLAALVSFPARAEVVENIRVPITEVASVPCAANGAGDVVVLSGDLHMLVRMTADQAGGGHATLHFQTQGLSGVGLTTGDKYQATDGSIEEFNFRFGEEVTLVENFRVIGQGPGNNFLVHLNVHVTINANGTRTASVANSSVECK